MLSSSSYCLSLITNHGPLIKMLDKLQKMEVRFLELEKCLADPQVISDQNQCQKLAKEYADLTSSVTTFRNYNELIRQEEDLKRILKEQQEEEFRALAREELESISKSKQELWEQLDSYINPRHHEKDRDLIIEVRAGTGGQEASLFAADLYRMYMRYADQRKWKVDVMSSHESETGGFKEIVFGVSGKEASKRLKWESGVHRVQRVPATETSGRIHTSAATVAVLFEAEEVEVDIDPKDLKIDIYRSSGPGGQSVNTTDSAVRITHLPSGIVVICQDERSQLKNKYKAMRVLRARLLDKIQREESEKASQDRKLKVGSGDRSEKIRTYNYPDRRVTDHRIGFTTHKLTYVMDGDLDDITDALIAAEAREALE